MATLVCFHAHPDDEAIGTGGVMAKAARDGHRVVLVTATKGECGEVADGFLDPGEQLGDRRSQELAEASKILGAARLEILGYHDSGMMGTVENDAPEAFWQADVEQAAQRLATILREEKADVLTMYDENGVYGHPDHIQVWRVGVRAAEIAGVAKVYEGTINRTLWRRRMEQGNGARRVLTKVDGVDTMKDVAEDEVPTIEFPIGVEEDVLTTAVDVREFVPVKKAAMRAHASQINDESWFLKMSDEDYALAFGTEWFRLRGAPAGIHEYDLFTGL